MAQKRIIRRKDDGTPETEEKKKAREMRMYFNEKTQAAIVAYQKSTSKKEKDMLYATEIAPAFEKLVENLINIHKFAGLYDTYEELKSDCVNFLFETLGKFDATRGTLAFSYFNVVAKNWLIIRMKQKSQKLKRNVSLDDPGLSCNEQRLIEEHNIVPSQETDIDNKVVASNILVMLHEISSSIAQKAKVDNEISCINSIITVFENIENIDLLNKSAVLLYVRELSGLNAKQLTLTMQTVKKYYRKYKQNDD